MNTNTACIRVTARVALAAAALLLAACDSSTPPPPATPEAAAPTTETQPAASSQPAGAVERWYDAERLARGAEVFNTNCAVCHGNKGQGSFNWRKPGADGKFPPPPLNGTAHAWHHPIAALASQIRNGAPGGQGAMPPFGASLNDEQLADVIAYVQSFWSDDIYAKWLQIELRSRQQQ